MYDSPPEAGELGPILRINRILFGILDHEHRNPMAIFFGRCRRSSQGQPDKFLLSVSQVSPFVDGQRAIRFHFGDSIGVPEFALFLFTNEKVCLMSSRVRGSESIIAISAGA